MTHKKALFVAIEGVDGSGKGTQAEKLVEALRAEHHRTTLLSFPRYAETLGGRLVGEYLNGDLVGMQDADPKVRALMFATDRMESRPLIEAHLTVDDILVCDRYVMSNLAHQAAWVRAEGEEDEGFKRQAFRYWVEQLEFGVFGLPEPDLTIIFDLPVEQAQKLIAKKTGRAYTDKAADLHEADTEYLRRVRSEYQAGAASSGAGRVAYIDLMRNGHLRSVDSIHKQVFETVKVMLSRSA